MKYKNLSFTLFYAGILYLLMNIKWTVDFKGYEILYQEYKTISPDIMFFYIAKIGTYLGKDYLFLIRSYYILIWYFLLKIIKYNLKNPFFFMISVMIYPMIFIVTQIRFYISVLLFIYALKYIKENKFLFSVIALISFFFHKSIIVLLFYYFFYKRNNIIKLSFLINVSSIFIFYLIKISVQNFNYFNKYLLYIENVGGSIKGAVFNLIFPIIWINLSIFFYKKAKKDSYNKILYNCIIYSSFFLTLSTITTIFSERYIRAIHIVVLLFLFRNIENISNKLKKIYIIGILCLSYINLCWILVIPKYTKNDTIQIEKFKGVIKSLDRNGLEKDIQNRIHSNIKKNK